MYSITGLAALRMGVGVSLLCAPKLVLTTIFPFLLPYTGPVAVATRMLGCRDIALAALFYTHHTRRRTTTTTTTVMDDHENREKSNIQLKQALTAGIITDSLDVIGYLWCFGEGMLALEGLPYLIGPAVGMLGLGLYGYYHRSR
ncbi:hypothetical protein BJY01DRAFT_253243 [Aspergillus pseudoustus]|uniref:Uncharacterized protein n=1 Tax=Aspergillus pseudoustus TaxID=1810923 RepID=A0ABR4J1Y4_9EURO